MKRKIREKQFHLSDLFLLPICLIFLYPFYYMVINTFKTMADMSMNPTGLPKEVYLQNYVDILTNPQIYQSFGNTLFITVCSVLAIVVIGEKQAERRVHGLFDDRFFGTVPGNPFVPF